MISLNNNDDFNEKSLKAGEVLFTVGERCKSSYIVKHGHVICFSLSKDKRVIPLSSVKDNGLIGEDDVFKEEAKHTYYAVAIKPTTLIILPRKDVMTYLNSAGDWMKRILFDLAERVANTNDVILEHKILDDRLNGGVSLSEQEEKQLLKAIS